jgi:ribosomal-protein-alanine N-acetyltransferase
MSAVLKGAFPPLRPMAEADLEEVMAIEQVAYDFPWTLGIFRDCLKFGYHAYVCREGRELLGYGLMSVAVGECHLLNLCVHPRHQNRGLGAHLVESMVAEAHTRGARVAFLEVRISNLAAQHLYHKLGFHEFGIRRNYYPARTGREDAILFIREFPA